MRPFIFALLLLILLIPTPTDSFTEVARLIPPGLQSEDIFGTSVAISSSGDIVAAGKSGGVYMYERNASGDLVLAGELTTNDASSTRFGESIAMSETGDTIAVSDIRNDNSKGAIYIFDRLVDGTYQQVQKITDPMGEVDDLFGSPVAMAGNFLITSATQDDFRDDDSDDETNTGQTTIYERDAGGTYNVVTQFIPSDKSLCGGFGGAVSITSTGLAAVGHSRDNSSRGSVYILEQTTMGGPFSFVKKITADDSVSGDSFGSTVTILEDGTLFVGSSGDDENGMTRSGSLYVFKRTGATTFTQQPDKIAVSDAAAEDFLGLVPVICEGDTLFVPVLGKNAVYEFTKNTDDTFTQTNKLTASDTGDINFGSSIAIANGVLVVGARNQAFDNTVIRTGAVYEFRDPNIFNPPPPPPPPAPTSGCFPGDAMVEVLGKGQMMMKNLAVGDQVRSQSGFSKVLSFGYNSLKDSLTFIKITTKKQSSSLLQKPLIISANHIVFVGENKSPKLAKDIDIGDRLTMMMIPYSQEEDLVQVVRKENVNKSGVYHPFTHDGTIVVNNILASAYSIEKIYPVISIGGGDDGYSIYDMHEFQHVIFAPLRILCEFSDESVYCSGKGSHDEVQSHHWDSVIESFITLLTFSTNTAVCAEEEGFPVVEDIEKVNLTSVIPMSLILLFLAHFVMCILICYCGVALFFSNFFFSIKD